VEICPLTKAKCPEVKDMDFLEKILAVVSWSLVVIKVVEPKVDEREALADDKSGQNKVVREK
jgi:hypothetical protein